MSLQPVVSLPLVPVQDLTPTYATNTTLTVTAGQCWMVDSATGLYTYSVVVPTALTINGAVNGLNGLDTGTLAASTLYYVYVIADATGFNVPGALISTSATAPTLPSGAVSGTGYNIFRRVGYIWTDSSVHFLPFYTSGIFSSRTYWWDTKIVALNGGTATSFTAIDLTTALAVPPVDNTPVIFQCVYTPSSATHSFQLRPTGSTATTGAIALSGAVAAVAMNQQVKVLSKLSSSKASVDYITTTTDSLTLDVMGFEFNV